MKTPFPGSITNRRKEIIPEKLLLFGTNLKCAGR